MRSDVRVEEGKFPGGKEARRIYHRNDILIENREAAIPGALFMAEGAGEGLEAGHAGHFLDAVNQKSDT